MVLRYAPSKAAHSAFESDLPAVDRFYAKRQYKPVWTDASSLALPARARCAS